MHALLTRPSTLARSARVALFIAPLASLCLACFASVDGDRAATGACPEGETCSDAAPEGLRFVGRALFDEEVVRLGPILVGGTFELGLATPDGSPLPAFELELDEPRALEGSRGTGTFAGDDWMPVDAYVRLVGRAPGTPTVRLVDPSTGALLDRMPIDVVAFDRVELVNVTAPDRDHLLAGCEQMIGVRLYGDDQGTPVRGFDEDMSVRAGTQSLAPEVRLWDCFTYTPGADAGEATFTVHAGGRDHVRAMPVRTLREEGLTSCPPTRRD